MAGQEREDLGPHSAGAQMLRGGMALSYGMDREATAIFENQLDAPSNAVNNDQAWFYLGKLAWQRGEAERTLQALSRMTPEYEGPLMLEAQYLRASALLRQGDASQAAHQWGGMPHKSIWRRHLGYNLGANHALQEEWWKAAYYFSTVGTALSDSQEERTLADKAYTAAGYGYLSSGDSLKSSREFRRVRLDSPYTSRALLGYGWSAVEQGNYLAALGPWQRLVTGSMLDENVQQGLLAVPYAYDQLGRPGVALEKYQFASSQYTRALADLEAAVVAFRDEPLAPLLGIEEQGNADWLFDQDILPGGNHSPYVRHLVTQHSFQVALRELNDLYSVARQLADARQRLEVLQQVDKHQQEVWADITEGDRRNQLALRQQELALAYESLRGRLQQAIEANDSRSLATSEQAALWSRLDRATALASGVAQPEKYAQRLSILRGLMIWQDSEVFPARAWEAQVTINELDALTTESARALQQVDVAVASQRQSSFSPRITALLDQVIVNREVVQANIGRSEAQLRQVAIETLEQQAGQLARALGQSRLAVAQLHDRAREGEVNE